MTKTHQIDIFHCQHCGRVVRQEHGLAVPFCCGTTMPRAACDTVFEAERPPARRAGPTRHALTAAAGEKT